MSLDAASRRAAAAALVFAAVCILAGCMPAATAAPAQEDPPTITRTILPAETGETPGTEKAVETAAPSPTPAPTGTPTGTPRPAAPDHSPPETLSYFTQPGDTLTTVARRFKTHPGEIRCVQPGSTACPGGGMLTENGGLSPGTPAAAELLKPGTHLMLPNRFGDAFSAPRLVPDSEVIFSSAASEFDTAAYLLAADGYLAGHRQYLMLNAWNTGAEIIDLTARENSINPRMLLGLLEYQCGCVLGYPQGFDPEAPFMQAEDYIRHDLYGQLIWAIYHLSNGYYGWRAGTLTEVTLADGVIVPLAPDLNAGTAAVYNLFAQVYGQRGFLQAIDPEEGFARIYEDMFGSAWAREQLIYPGDTAQPALALPFETNVTWSYTGGPHPAYEGNGPLASLDFAPASAGQGCLPTTAWVLAAADGLIARAEFGTVVQDLDGDGNEHTGWVIVYLHIAQAENIETGRSVKQGEPIGQPSCEGGRANGTHLHIARKLNGEWIAAGSGPLPFKMDGWVARDGEIAYKGTLVRDGVKLTACTCSWRAGWIEKDRP